MSQDRTPLAPARHATLPEGLRALTATGRGMKQGTMMEAARAAFKELASSLQQAGLFGAPASWLALMPDRPQGPEDPQARYLGGVLFGYDMAHGRGQGEARDVKLSGTLAWTPLAAGRYAVFLHVGPYEGLAALWGAIYREWLPTSGEAPRESPPLELMLNSPEDTPAHQLRTEVWVPVA